MVYNKNNYNFLIELNIRFDLTMSSTENSSSHSLLPVGEEDFRELIDNKLLYVDKTLLIKEFLDNKHVKVSLITRPRRFGKTLNLSMLHYFFAEKIDGEVTKDLFKGLKISTAGEEYMLHQGQYPVIFVTFKGIRGSSYKVALTQLKSLMKLLYEEHSELLNSPQLSDSEKKYFKAVLNEEITETQLNFTLLQLTIYLRKHYQKKVMVLIDEYDVPIQAGYLNSYYQQMIEMIHGLLSACLKTNRHLKRAVLTGITRVSKESLFSGLNNLVVYSLLDYGYKEHFGFTEAEVNKLVHQMGYQSKLMDIKAWYNGYEIGDTTLYNPWSIINFMN